MTICAIPAEKSPGTAPLREAASGLLLSMVVADDGASRNIAGHLDREHLGLGDFLSLTVGKTEGSSDGVVFSNVRLNRDVCGDASQITILYSWCLES